MSKFDKRWPSGQMPPFSDLRKFFVYLENDEFPCAVCGDSTHWVDSRRTPICSEECYAEIINMATHSIERLVHFQCGSCEKWWSIGDAPIDTHSQWYCPWCGVKQPTEEIENEPRTTERTE